MKTAAKVFLIIGMVGNSLGLIFSFLGTPLMLILSGCMAAVILLVGIFTFKKLDSAHSKNEIIGWGIASLILVNLIAGILVLCIPESEFEKNGSEPLSANDLEKKLQELETLRSNGTISEDEYQDLRNRILNK